MRKRCCGPLCILTALEGSKWCERCQAKAEEKYKAYTSLYDRQRAVFDSQYRKFYNSTEWKRIRLEVLGENPICCKCNKAFANEVHHDKPLRTTEGWEKRLSKDNLLSWCKPCHSRHEKTKGNR